MRAFLWVALLGFFGLGCTRVEVHSCSDDEGCGPQARCLEGYCVYDPLPDLQVHLSQASARVGDTVLLTAEARLPGEVPLSYQVYVHPPAAAVVSEGEKEGEFLLLIAKPRTEILAIVRVRTESGREVDQSVSIAPLNSPPEITLRTASDEAQPGGIVHLIADARDPDGDEVELRWSHPRGDGELVAEGALATLQLIPDELDAWYEVVVVASDGLEESEASVTFQAANLPPRIVAIDAPAVDHVCGLEFGCSAQARLTAHVHDVGPLDYLWRSTGALGTEGLVHVEGHEKPNPLFIVRGNLSDRVASSYGFELIVSDSYGAVSKATGAFEVLNRQPTIQAGDDVPLQHTYLSEDRYRWVRSPGTTEVWFDPDGDPPLGIEWSSPSGAVRFSDTKAIDPTIEVTGPGRLHETGVDVVVRARDPNGAEVTHRSTLVLGNLAPRVRSVDSEKATWNLGTQKFHQRVVVKMEDPDEDPLDVTMDFAPDHPVAGFHGLTMAFLEQTSGTWVWEVRGPSSANGITYRVVVEATDPFGATTTETADVVLFRAP